VRGEIGSTQAVRSQCITADNVTRMRQCDKLKPFFFFSGSFSEQRFPSSRCVVFHENRNNEFITSRSFQTRACVECWNYSCLRMQPTVLDIE
jgi:hypothetical protein